MLRREAGPVEMLPSELLLCLPAAGGQAVSSGTARATAILVFRAVSKRAPPSSATPPRLLCHGNGRAGSVQRRMASFLLCSPFDPASSARDPGDDFKDSDRTAQSPELQMHHPLGLLLPGLVITPSYYTRLVLAALLEMGIVCSQPIESMHSPF